MINRNDVIRCLESFIESNNDYMILVGDDSRLLAENKAYREAIYLLTDQDYLSSMLSITNNH